MDPQTAPSVVPIPTASQSLVEEQAADAEMADGRIILAVAAYTRAIINDSTRASPYDGLSAALLRAGKATHCAAACRAALLRAPARVPTRARLALAAQMTGGMQEAADQWRGVVERDGAYPDARARLAVLLYFLEDYPEAWAQFHAAEAAGQHAPAQLRDLLVEHMAEPP